VTAPNAGSVRLGIDGRCVIMRGGRRVRPARTIDARVRSAPSPGDRPSRSRKGVVDPFWSRPTGHPDKSLELQGRS